MKNKKIISIAILIVLIGLSVYCLANTNSADNDGSITITDMANRTVKVPKHVDKVMGFDSANREICYLNCSEKIVGIQNKEKMLSKVLPYMCANPHLKNLTVFGSLYDGSVDFESLTKEKPEVIFVDSFEKAETIESKTGIPAVVVYTGMVGTEDQYKNYTDSLELMGEILEKENRANDLIKYMDNEINTIDKKVKNVDNNKTVYIGGHAYCGPHGLTYTNSYYPPFNYLHLKNIASNNNSSENKYKAFDVGKEQLIKWNPDFIFIESSSIISHQSDSITNPEYKNLSAVKNNNVHQIYAYCIFYYNKEEMLINSYYIGKVCYEDQFNDIDIKDKSLEIFEKFLGKTGYDDFIKGSGYKCEQIKMTA